MQTLVRPIWLTCVLCLMPVAQAFAGYADPFHDLHPKELELIRWLQSWGDYGLLMRCLSAMGPGAVLWAIVLGTFFGFSPKLGARLAVFTLLGLWFRELIALSLQSPRPYWLDPAIHSFGDVATRRPTYGLPSGHAFAGAAFWFYLAAEIRRGWAWGLAAAVVLLICFSRVYLGVHFVSDVVLGLILGALYTLLFRKAEPLAIPWLVSIGPRNRLIFTALAAILLLGGGLFVRSLVLTQPVPPEWLKFGTDARKAGVFAILSGSLTGLAAGLAITKPDLWTAFAEACSWRNRGLRVVIAVVLGYGVSKLVDHQVVTARLPAGEGPFRLACLFLLWSSQALIVWLFLPRWLSRFRGARR